MVSGGGRGGDSEAGVHDPTGEGSPPIFVTRGTASEGKDLESLTLTLRFHLVSTFSIFIQSVYSVCPFSLCIQSVHSVCLFSLCIRTLVLVGSNVNKSLVSQGQGPGLDLQGQGHQLSGLKAKAS